MVMKNYDEYDQGTVRRFSPSSDVTTSTTAGRRIFTCSTQTGDKVKPNPHFYTKHIYKFSYGFRIMDYCYQGVYAPSGSAGFLDTDAVSHLINPATYEGEISDRAMEKIYDKIKGNSNFVVDLAESAATLRMLKATLNLRKVLTSFFDEVWDPKTKFGRRLPTHGQRRLDYISEKWLEYRYGWSPLVYSIYDSMDTLGGKHLINGFYPVKGRASTIKRSQAITGLGTVSSPKVTTTTELSSRIEYCYMFALDPSARIYDWTSLNPIGIAWELLPLSFVADWVVNVSQQLSLWENYLLFNSRVKDGYMTRTSLQQTEVSTYGFTKGQYWRWPDGSFIDGPNGDETLLKTSSLRTTSLNRSPTKSLPLPSGIRLNVNFGSKRQLDAAALVHQIVAKRFR